MGALLDVMTIGVSETKRRTRIRREARLAWDQVAAAHGVELEDDPANSNWQRFVVEVDDVAVAVEHSGGVDGETRLSAKAAAPSHERLRIYRSGRFSPIARAVGFQDVLLGDEEFDDAYIIKAGDPVFARAWVNSLVRSRISRASGYRFELKAGRVKAVLEGLESDAKQLRAAIRALAAFADGRQQVVRSWAKLTKRYRGKVTKQRGRWAVLRGKHEGISFRIDTHEHADRHYTFVDARAGSSALLPFVVAHHRQAVSTSLPRAVNLEAPEHYSIFSDAPLRVAALLDQPRRDLLSELGISKIETTPESVKVFVPGICADRGALTKMVALATDVVRGAEQGPYR